MSNMDDFIHAEIHLEKTRAAVLERIETDPDSLRGKEITAMVDDIELAAIQVKQTGLKVTESAISEARQFANQAGKIEYSIMRAKADPETRLAEIKQDVIVAQKVEEIIKYGLVEYNQLKDEISRLEFDRNRLEVELRDISSNYEPIEHIKLEIAKVARTIQEYNDRISMIQHEKCELEKQYASSLGEREHNNKLKEEIETLIRNNKISISKLRDEDFIRKNENEIRVGKLNEIIKVRNQVEEELVELKRGFKADSIIDDEEKEEVRDELNGLAAEERRLIKEIERIRELIFRNRVKY